MKDQFHTIPKCFYILNQLFLPLHPCLVQQDEKYQYKDSVALEGCKVDVGGANTAATPHWPSSASLSSSSSTLGGSSDAFNGGGGGLFGGGGTAGGGRKSGSSNSFLLVVAGNRKAYTIIAKNEMERDKWLEAVSCAM